MFETEVPVKVGGMMFVDDETRHLFPQDRAGLQADIRFLACDSYFFYVAVLFMGHVYGFQKCNPQTQPLSLLYLPTPVSWMFFGVSGSFEGIVTVAVLVYADVGLKET
jgi:hypothetical protein